MIRNVASSGGDARTTTTSHLQQRKGRQIQDINHLLGFHLPPRAPPPPSAPRRSARRNPAHGTFNRSRFVHQFRFIVKPDKDYTAHFADPDIHLDWTDILQVILPTSSSALSSVSTSTWDQPFEGEGRGSIPTCPICLSEPTAARMTKCGHVFCYPCLLHYLALADGQKWRKCPVCWDSVYAKDLKSVKWQDPVATAAPIEVSASTPDPVNGDSRSFGSNTGSKRESLKMRLIRRPQISTLALPRSSTWPSEAVPPLRAPWQFTPDAAAYAKFMLAPPEYMKAELEGNLQELEQEIATLRRWGVKGGTDEELGIVFVQTAIRKVEEQLEKTELLKSHMVMTARKKSLRELAEVQEKAGQDKRDHHSLPVVSETSSSEVEAEMDSETHSTEAPLEFLGARTGLSGNAPAFTPGSIAAANANAKSRSQRRNVNPTAASDPDSSYYFYQAASGQNIFLHPLDIKILKAHFGTYQGLPDTIEVAVEGADEGTVTEDLRRRCRWLSHLPTASDVVFIEADLSHVVSKSSLEPYAGPLKQRRQKRRDKARREDKAKAKSEQREQDAARPLYATQYSAEYAGLGATPSMLEPSIAALSLSSSSFDEPAHFPPPAPSSNLSGSPPPPPLANGYEESMAGRHQAGTTTPATTVWGTRSFATTLRGQAPFDARDHAGDYWDDTEFDDRWHDFEERITGGGTGGGGGPNARTANGRGGSASGSNSGSNRAQSGNTASNGGGAGGSKKKSKKLTLNLSGSAMRGAR